MKRFEVRVTREILEEEDVDIEVLAENEEEALCKAKDEIKARGRLYFSLQGEKAIDSYEVQGVVDWSDGAPEAA